jgi:ATP-dependent Clp protease ATP-binding subunit ClpA
MFERYTEKARRTIFFARYEASQYGCPHIETEHLLLGLLREDRGLTDRIVRSHTSVESIRKQIDAHTTRGEFIPTSVDLPLSEESKRVLTYASEEAETLNHNHIGTQHLLLGVLREEHCFAAEILRERGLQLTAVREEVARQGDVRADESRPTASDTSSVMIISTPAGAEIEVDDVFVGHTPAEVALIPGERMIRISKPGYQSWQRNLQVMPRSLQTISADLESLPA